APRHAQWPEAGLARVRPLLLARVPRLRNVFFNFFVKRMNNAPPNKKSLSASEVTMRCAIEHKGAVKIPDSFTSRSDAAGGIFSFHKNFLTRRSHKHFYQSARALRSSGPEMASRLLLHTDNFALRNNN